MAIFSWLRGKRIKIKWLASGLAGHQLQFPWVLHHSGEFESHIDKIGIHFIDFRSMLFYWLWCSLLLHFRLFTIILLSLCIIWLAVALLSRHFFSIKTRTVRIFFGVTGRQWRWNIKLRSWQISNESFSAPSESQDEFVLQSLRSIVTQIMTVSRALCSVTGGPQPSVQSASYNLKHNHYSTVPLAYFIVKLSVNVHWACSSQKKNLRPCLLWSELCNKSVTASSEQQNLNFRKKYTFLKTFSNVLKKI